MKTLVKSIVLAFSMLYMANAAAAIATISPMQGSLVNMTSYDIEVVYMGCYYPQSFPASNQLPLFCLPRAQILYAYGRADVYINPPSDVSVPPGSWDIKVTDVNALYGFTTSYTTKDNWKWNRTMTITQITVEGYKK